VALQAASEKSMRRLPLAFLLLLLLLSPLLPLLPLLLLCCACAELNDVRCEWSVVGEVKIERIALD